jgi:hypothetical protein
MPTTTAPDRATRVLDLAIAHELRGEWARASEQFARAATLFTEARAWSEAEDALRRSGTCARVASH